MEYLTQCDKLTTYWKMTDTYIDICRHIHFCYMYVYTHIYQVSIKKTCYVVNVVNFKAMQFRISYWSSWEYIILGRMRTVFSHLYKYMWYSFILQSLNLKPYCHKMRVWKFERFSKNLEEFKIIYYTINYW
jgi:hypothetical protein